MSKHKRESFIFYKSFYEAIKELPLEAQGILYSAIFEYNFNKKLPELNGIYNGIWCLIKPQLDANNKKYKNGTKGGRPPKDSYNNTIQDNLNKTKTKPNNNLDITKTEPNDNVNVNANVNANANGNGSKKFFFWYKKNINPTTPGNNSKSYRKIMEQISTILEDHSEKDLYDSAKKMTEEVQEPVRIKNFVLDSYSKSYLEEPGVARPPQVEGIDNGSGSTIPDNVRLAYQKWKEGNNAVL